MRREGCDEENIQMSDVLCDFCHQEWTLDRAMVEGHRGACICGNCLMVAWMELIERGISDPVGAEEMCVLCREMKADDPHWRSPAYDEALACARCVKRSAGVLHKDPDIAWTKPGRTPVGE